MAVERWRPRLLLPLEPQATAVLRKQPNAKGIVHDSGWVPGLLRGFSAVPPAQKIRVSDVEVKTQACTRGQLKGWARSVATRGGHGV